MLVAVHERPSVAADLGAVTGRVAGADPKTPTVVFLEGAKKKGKKPARHVLGQQGMRFLPDFLLIAVGDSVAFPNDDLVTHNVFSVSRAKRFDLALYPPGSSKEVLFDTAGTVDVFCNIHENMHAVIVVAPSDYHQRVDAQGQFRLASVAPGTYSIVAWRKGKEVAREEVTVEGGDDTSVELTIKK